jgi:CRP-like cAMP-binding protein
MGTLSDDQRRLLTHQGWLASEDSAFQNALLASATTRTLANGGSFLHNEDPAVHALLAGHLRLGRVFADGNEAVVWLGQSAVWFGASFLFHHFEPVLTVTACYGDAVLATIPRAHVEALVAKDPRHLHRFGRMVAEHLLLTVRLLTETVAPTIAQRVGCLLLLLCEHLPAPADGVYRLRISQEDLAGMLGMARQSANAALQLLEAEKLLTHGYRLVAVPDLAALRRYVAETPPLLTRS